MRVVSRILCVAAILSVCGVSPVMAGFINGDFETDISGWQGYAFDHSYGVDPVDTLSQVAAASPDGSSYVLQADLSSPTIYWFTQSHVCGAVSQLSPDTTAGDLHTISFWARLVSGGAADTYLSVQKFYGGSNAYQVLLNPDNSWRYYAITNADLGTANALCWGLLDHNGDTVGGGPEVLGVFQIDHVQLDATPAPEPSTLVLLTAALIGLLAYAWRKRR